LPPNPASQVKLPVKSYLISGGGGFCWLEAASGLANYLEPDIDLDKFILYDHPTLFMAARDRNQRYGPGLSMIHAFVNLGYTPFRGATSPIHPPQNIFPDIDPQNFIYFKNTDEEFVFMKKLLSAGIVPIIGISNDPFENISGGAFVSVTGYDQNGVWINVSPPSEKYAPGKKYFLEPPDRYEARLVSYDKFRQVWTGEHQLFWFMKTGNRKTEGEIYAENKKNAREAPANMQKTIEFLKANGDLQLFTYSSDTPTAAALYRYFQKKGNPDLANQYLQLANTYESPNPKDGRQKMIETLTSAYPSISKAATMWP
ncbi:MAG: hypothetical protein AAB506_02935, partial [Patescibacteria group bacterium]